jgi:hypothetical protein
MNSNEKELSWKKLHSEIREIKGLTNKQMERISHGWHYLERALGPSWLNNAVSSRHLWNPDIRNNEPWIKSYYGVIGERINDLSGISGFDLILEKLRTTNDPVGVIAEMNAGWKLHKIRINFQYVETTQKGKTADIRAFIDRKEIAVEVTVHRISPFQIRQRRNFDRIARALSNSKVSSGGKVYRPLSIPHTDDIIEHITVAISKALKENRKVELQLYDIADFCIAPIKLQNEVETWKKKLDLKPSTSLHSPDFYDNAGRRIQRTIQKKAKQIPEKVPGVIYIEGLSFNVASYGLVGSQYFKVHEIEEAVFENQNLLFVVLNNLNISENRERIALARKVSRKPHSYISIKNIAPYLSENTWLISNRFHKWPTLRHKKLIRALWYRGRVDPMKRWEKRAIRSVVKQFEESEPQ